MGLGQIFAKLPRSFRWQFQCPREPRGQGGRAVLVEYVVAIRPQTRNGEGEFVGPPRSLTKPERDVGWLILGIFDENPAGLDLENAVADVAQLEDVAGQTVKGEIFIECTDAVILRAEDDLVVELVRNRSAIGDGR